jgi:hypothetical protein
MRWLAIDGVCLRDHPAEGVRRDGTAGMQQAEVADFHEAVREHVLEEPAEKLHGVKGSGAWARTAKFTGGEGDGVVCETHEALVGDGDPEDRGGKGGEGGVSVVIGLRVDVPGEVPALWVDMLQESGVAHVFFEDGAGDG